MFVSAIVNFFILQFIAYAAIYPFTDYLGANCGIISYA